MKIFNKKINFYSLALIVLTLIAVAFINVKPRVAQAAHICDGNEIITIQVNALGYGLFNNLIGVVPQINTTKDVNVVSGSVLTFTSDIFGLASAENYITFPGSDDYNSANGNFPKYPNPSWFPDKYPGPGTDNPYWYPGPIYNSAGYRRPYSVLYNNYKTLEYPGANAFGSPRKYDTNPIVGDGQILIESVPYCTGGVFPEVTDFTLRIHTVPACKIDTFTCDASDNLSWATSNCTSQSISPTIGAVPASGSTAAANTTYTLNVTNPNVVNGLNSQTSIYTCPAPVIQKPSLVSIPATNVDQTSATLGARITSDGGAAVTDHGICWSATDPGAGNPVTTNCSSDGAGTVGVDFTRNISGLSASTQYYFNGYATNSAGTGYSGSTSFTTDTLTPPPPPPPPPPPTLSEFEVNVIKTGQGTVTSSPAGAACAAPSSTCWKYTEGDAVTITAAKITGRVFVGWGGDCNSSNSTKAPDGSGGTCTFSSIDGNKNVKANFAIDPNYHEF